MSQAQRKKLEARLDGRQIRAALLCVEREFAAEADRRTFESIAQEIGVSTVTLWEWRTQNRNFIDYSNYLADDFLAGERAFVYRQLRKLIGQGSVKGIDLYFKRHGLITERQLIETKDANDVKSNEDIAKEIDELDDLLAEGESE